MADPSIIHGPGPHAHGSIDERTWASAVLQASLAYEHSLQTEGYNMLAHSKALDAALTYLGSRGYQIVENPFRLLTDDR